MALWGGRFEGGVATSTQEFGASLPVDKHLYKQDIAGSKAHAGMLAKQGIISDSDAQAITEGLDQIEAQIDAGDFVFDINDEDIHMAIESELTRRIGEAGKRLHTGRSRNDQVATDTRLAVKALTKDLMEANLNLRRVLVEVAEANKKAILPGMTHLQHAQPVLFSHHLLAYYWMFTRDYKRIVAAFEAADASPLGAAALAGTTYPLDRVASAHAMGFKQIRGKTGRVYGNLVQLLVTCKGLPLAYNKDLQEDKEGALDSAHTLAQCLSVMSGMISTMTVNADAMRAACKVGHLAATDVADYLAKRGMPFREAHAVVGHLVLECDKRGCQLDDLPLEVFKEASPLFGADITSALDIDAIVAARTTQGGTAPTAVAEQMRLVRASYTADEAYLEGLPYIVPMGQGA